MTEVCIVGRARRPFGKLEEPDVEALIRRVPGAAIVDAGLAPSEVDGVFEGAAIAWSRALEEAGLKLPDLSFVETHNCFTIAELIEYEAIGPAPHGQGARAVLEGWTAPDGKLPVNRSGGLKAEGHPVGATGVFNMGGAAVANDVSILERAR